MFTHFQQVTHKDIEIALGVKYSVNDCFPHKKNKKKIIQGHVTYTTKDQED